MTLILLYLVVLILVAVVLFGIASLVFGRGEQLPPLPRGTTATVLPASEVTGADVEAVKFTQVLRGYKTSEVDWVLDRLGAEIDQLRAELDAAEVRAAACSVCPGPRMRPAAGDDGSPAGATGPRADRRCCRTYHDQEWGRPLRGRVALFERMSLEAFQSGLSWLIILRKRENFRRAFDGFDIETVAGYTERDVDRLMADPGIVRNRAKIEATIANARLAAATRGRSVRPAVVLRAAAASAPGQTADVPSSTPESAGLARRPQKPRLPVRRTHHRLRVDAGHRDGRRPSADLLGALRTSRSPGLLHLWAPIGNNGGQLEPTSPASDSVMCGGSARSGGSTRWRR